MAKKPLPSPPLSKKFRTPSVGKGTRNVDLPVHHTGIIQRQQVSRDSRWWLIAATLVVITILVLILFVWNLKKTNMVNVPMPIKAEQSASANTVGLPSVAEESIDTAASSTRGLRQNAESKNQEVPEHLISDAPAETMSYEIGGQEIPADIPQSLMEEAEKVIGKSYAGEVHPETRLRLLSPQEIGSWSLEQIRYAINEIYARHGADFEKAEVKQVFLKFDWYRPEPGKDYNSAETDFSRIEMVNVKLLAEMRAKLMQESSSHDKRPPETRAKPQTRPKEGSLRDRTLNLDNL